MPTTDPRVDAYIAKSAEFARPILSELRAIVHEACPEVEETLKWSMPSFGYHGILCGMAAFKQHCTFGFWKHELVLAAGAERTAMGSFGRVTKRSDLPSRKTLIALIRKAMALNASGAKAPSRTKKAPRPEPPMPDALLAALRKDKKAHAVWTGFAPSHRREYIEWITEAKTDATRDRRLATTLQWLAEGKQRNWKYAQC